MNGLPEGSPSILFLREREREDHMRLEEVANFLKCPPHLGVVWFAEEECACIPRVNNTYVCGGASLLPRGFNKKENPNKGWF